MKGFPGSSSGSNVSRTRLFLVGGIFIVIFIIYLTKLFSLQVVNTGIYKKKAKDVSERSEIIPSQRGRIYDRNYDFPLAVNIDSFAIHLTASDVVNISIDELITKLSSALSLSEEVLRNKIPRNSTNRYKAVEIAYGVSFEKIAYIAEHIDEFEGISWSSKPYRFYHQTGSVSHILGYTGPITTDELQILYNQGYSYDSELGKSGVELIYDSILRGTNGRRTKTVDVKGRDVDRKDNIEPPKNGMNIRLTIDREIQDLAEKALGSRVGSVIVLQPSTGEILAMVSYPSFDPNLFSLPGPTNYGALTLDPQFPFLNRPIQSNYEPASTFKLILTAAILDLEAIDPEKTIVCEGQFTVGDREISCHKKSGHGPLNLKEALEKSCNVYFGTVGMENLGIDEISKYAQYLGLSTLTGIDLPGEVVGNIPTRAWKERERNEKWQLGDTINVSIGQGDVLSTPLQIANAIATIVNNGVAYRPHLLKEVIEPISGEVIERIEPEIIRSTPMKMETFTTLKEYMRSVVVDGTSNAVILNQQVEVAAKTGTGEAWGRKDNWHSWFASYGPYETENPDERVVVLTMVEAYDDTGRNWDWWAPKAADIIYEGIFGNKSYEEVIKDFHKRDVWYAREIEIDEDS